MSCKDFKIEDLEELMGREISFHQGQKIRDIFCDQQKSLKNQTVNQECAELRSQLSRGPKGRELNDIEPVCSSQKSGGQEFLAISGGVFWGTIVCSTAAWVFYKTCVKKWIFFTQVLPKILWYRIKFYIIQNDIMAINIH